jgi:small-conductance mechanosensitive channel
MNDNGIELRYTYTRESFITARKDFKKVFPEPVYEKLKRWILQALFLMFGIPAIFLSLTGLYATAFPFRIMDAWIIFVYIAVLVIIVWDLVSWLRSKLKPPAEGYDKDDRWKGERYFQVSDTGIQMENPMSQSTIKWKSFNHVIETPSAYLFTYGVKDFPEWFYLPKYAFETEEKEELFKSIVRRNSDLKEVK